MGKKAKLTEKQTEILNNHTEKAKPVFKWLFALFNTKLYYDEEYDGWFFSSEAKFSKLWLSIGIDYNVTTY